jgi:two-component system, NarL family, response regulator NreC
MVLKFAPAFLSTLKKAQSDMYKIRVLVADDHNLLREGVIALLAAEPLIQIVAESNEGMDALEKAKALQPDVAVLDISLPNMSGIELVRRICNESPRTRSLILTMHEEEEYVLHAVRAGAYGFLLKDSVGRELIAAVKDLAAGRKHFGTHAGQILAQQMARPQTPLDDPYRDLTDREREVFHLIIEGLVTKEIAVRLNISTRTAENHRNHVLSKLDVRNTAGLLRYAARYRMLN